MSALITLIRFEHLLCYYSFCFSQLKKSEDGTKVELIEPPNDAIIGERVTIEGITETYEPFSSTQTKKKKTFDIVSKELKTIDDGIATWQGKPIITSKGPCKAATLVGAPIS